MTSFLRNKLELSDLLWILKHCATVAAKVFKEVYVLGFVKVEVILFEDAVFDESIFP